ncbi:MAG: FHA domain-containing serine/threonine-protein kinase [Planctomycetaceae bacterium]|nr:FHA domain-containing serine/threonine-protein kinase [Planctomycetaceae bacterium]
MTNTDSPAAVPDPTDEVGGAQVYATLLLSDVGGNTIERDILRETTLIGSGRGCDVRLKSEDIAAAHCILSLDGGTLRIRDLGSREGTVINGEPIRSAILSDGDEIRLGRHRMRIETNLPGRGFRGFYIDVFQVNEILGSGGMCWIYGGRNSVSRERVALKVLPSHHSPRMLAHFGIEARAGLLLSHPNVVHVHKLVQADSLYLLVMEYLEAITLQELVETQGPVPWRQACSFVRQLALGLDHVHHRGIVHRDIKPANILCARHGQVKLIDFGLAMLADDPNQERLSRVYANQILGTADYISPEQSRRSHDVDGRSDLYSLGCAMFFALTGGVPFPVLAIKDKIKAHRHQPPRDPREIVRDLPPQVADICLRMLAKERSDRYPSGAAVAEALLEYSQQSPVNFDWSALLSVRATAAHRRLSKLLAKRRQAADTIPAATVVLESSTEPSTKPSSRGSRPIEADFMESLRDDTLPSTGAIDRAEWGELFQLWTQLTQEQRQQLLESARLLDRPPIPATAAPT